MKQNSTIAAIDIGSNSVHLVIANADAKGQLQILDIHKETIRLFKDLTPDRNFAQIAFEKCKKVLLAMVEISNHYGAHIRAVATQATREARNHVEFIDYIYKETGIHVEIIDGFEEARLSFLGMEHALPIEKHLTLGIDIGGGSTEIVVAKGKKFDLLTSVKLGALSLSQSFLNEKNPTPKTVKKLRNHITVRLAPIIIGKKTSTIKKAVATSGTAKCVAQIHHLLNKTGVLDEAHGYQLTALDLANLEKTLIEIGDPKILSQKFDLDEKRSQIILAGTMVFNAISQLFQIDEWTISTFGLREGLAIDCLVRGGFIVSQEYRDIRWESVIRFGEKYRIDSAHADFTKTLAKKIFDRIPRQLLEESEKRRKYYRDLLKIAAYLHEVGKFIGFARYHKHTYYVISRGNMIGFSQDEKHLIALIARFARKKIPDTDTKKKNHVLQSNIKILRILSTCLRLAIGLNRTRQRKIKNLQISDSPDHLTVKLTCHDGYNLDSELQILQKETQTFTSVFKKPLEFLVLSDKK